MYRTLLFNLNELFVIVIFQVNNKNIIQNKLHN
jgi:hypothetical protein